MSRDAATRRLRPPVDVDSRPALAAMAAAFLVGSAGNLTLPLWLGAAVEGLGADERAVALVGSAELACLAAASLVIAPRAGRTNRRSLAVAGALLVCLGHGVAALAPSLAVLLVARMLAGAGAGAAVASANASAAATSVPERAYARIFVLGGAGCALLMVGMPYAIGPWGTAGAFGALLAATLVSSPLLVFIPAHPPASEDPVKPALSLGPAVAAALLASLIVTVGLDALWAFAERIGRRAGLEPTALGLVLGLASLAVLAAAALASWLGLRLGRVAPLVLGFGVLAGSAVALGHARSPGVYVVAVLLLGPGFFFTQPFIMGAMAALDPYGRVSAAAGGAMTVGAALGPGVGGLLVAAEGYASLGWLGATCGLVALALMGPVALHVDRVRNRGLPRKRST